MERAGCCGVDLPPLCQESRAEGDLSQLEKAVRTIGPTTKKRSTVLVGVTSGTGSLGTKAVVDLERILEQRL